MARARMLCNPSVTASSGDMEGFGMVFAEAQAVGTPVVSFAHAAIPEAVNHGKTGLLCPEGAIGPLADSLLQLLGNDVFWSETSRNATLWVQDRFDIAKQTQILEDMYDECVLESQKASICLRVGETTPATPVNLLQFPNIPSRPGSENSS